MIDSQPDSCPAHTCNEPTKELHNLYIKKFEVQNGGSKHVFFNEENMKVIQNIFKEEFEKQEKNIGNLINVNFEIAMEKIKK